MTFLDIDVSDAQEARAVPGDEEYNLRIVSIDQKDDKNGLPYILPRFEVPAEPTSKEFTKFIRLPYDGMSAKDLNKCKWALKSFFEAFNIPLVGERNWDDYLGNEGWAILGFEETDEWGEQNFVRKFIGPK